VLIINYDIFDNLLFSKSHHFFRTLTPEAPDSRSALQCSCVTAEVD